MIEEKKSGAAGVVSIVFAVLNGIGLLVSVGYSLHIRNKFIAIFQELGAELPALTQAILDIPWALWILVALGLLGMLAAKEFISKKWIPLLLNGIFVLLGIVYWAVFSTAMTLPLMHLMKQVEHG